MELMRNDEYFQVEEYLFIRSLEKVGVGNVVRYLKSNLHIKKLCIDCNKINEDECKELSLIKSLDSINVKIADADDESFKGLSELVNLTVLKVTQSCFTSEGARGLSKCSNLIDLELQESRCSIKQVDEQYRQGLVPVYLESLEKLTNITKLTLKTKFINDDFVKFFVDIKSFQNLESLELSEINIGNLSASALAKSHNFPNLVVLKLRKTDIDIKGVKELALSSTLKNLEVLDLEECDLLDVEGIEELSKFSYNRMKPEFRITAEMKKFYVFMMGVFSNKNSIDDISIGSIFCSIAKRTDKICMYILTQKEKYQLRLNAVLAGYHKPCLFGNCLGKPGGERFLFEFGALPAVISSNDEKEVKVINAVSQSVHLTSVAKKTHFFTKYLVDSVNTTKEQVQQGVRSFIQNIPSLLRRFKYNPIRLNLLSLTDTEKMIVMENTLRGQLVPSDQEFIESVFHKAKRFLEENCDTMGSYFFSTTMQFDNTIGEATITIPQCIGYVKLLIDKLPIPLEEMIELLVTVMEQNPNLVKDRLKKENMDRPQLYKWVENMTFDNIAQLFEIVSGLDIEQIWREQKEFVLLKQIYISATAYGEENSACANGIWTQIIASLDEIDSKLLDHYGQHLDKEKESERLMSTISIDNSSLFADDLARKLMEYAACRPRFRKSLEEFVFGMIDIKNFENITFDQQQIFAQLNREFTSNVKTFLPNYKREIPTKEEYDIVIKNVLNSKTLQNFAKGVSRKP